ncbi:uncharacterized protein TNCV_1399461 [Trichonephila clavipes]|nr:uncharacterized protein TNCV_1399461 [Trichonephila clavipes]
MIVEDPCLICQNYLWLDSVHFVLVHCRTIYYTGYSHKLEPRYVTVHRCCEGCFPVDEHGCPHKECLTELTEVCEETRMQYCSCDERLPEPPLSIPRSKSMQPRQRRLRPLLPRLPRGGELHVRPWIRAAEGRAILQGRESLRQGQRGLLPLLPLRE